ncbi:hypothetical protein [Bacillus thuringiensis]|uniref:hypothetical protein n=1 Tax=Bacillus thuringiensis TaxID=1428 RepID=UPI0015CEFB4E|nr:hypothetical protein [Bacillus thuringiensis]
MENPQINAEILVNQLQTSLCNLTIENAHLKALLEQSNIEKEQLMQGQKQKAE